MTSWNSRLLTAALRLSPVVLSGCGGPAPTAPRPSLQVEPVAPVSLSAPQSLSLPSGYTLQYTDIPATGHPDRIDVVLDGNMNLPEDDISEVALFPPGRERITDASQIHDHLRSYGIYSLEGARFGGLAPYFAAFDRTKQMAGGLTPAISIDVSELRNIAEEQGLSLINDQELRAAIGIAVYAGAVNELQAAAAGTGSSHSPHEAYQIAVTWAPIVHATPAQGKQLEALITRSETAHIGFLMCEVEEAVAGATKPSEQIRADVAALEAFAEAQELSLDPNWVERQIRAIDQLEQSETQALYNTSKAAYRSALYTQLAVDAGIVTPPQSRTELKNAIDDSLARVRATAAPLGQDVSAVIAEITQDCFSALIAQIENKAGGGQTETLQSIEKLQKLARHYDVDLGATWIKEVFRIAVAVVERKITQQSLQDTLQQLVDIEEQGKLYGFNFSEVETLRNRAYRHEFEVASSGFQTQLRAAQAKDYAAFDVHIFEAFLARAISAKENLGDPLPAPTIDKIRAVAVLACMENMENIVLELEQKGSTMDAQHVFAAFEQLYGYFEWAQLHGNVTTLDMKGILARALPIVGRAVAATSQPGESAKTIGALKVSEDWRDQVLTEIQTQIEKELNAVFNLDPATIRKLLLRLPGSDSGSLTLYDLEGNQIKQVNIQSDGARGWSTTYRYENGRLAKKTDYNSDGTRNGSTTYRYENGRLAKKTDYNSDGTRNGSTTYSYKNGRLAKETDYNSDGTRGWSTIYRYEDGRLVEETDYRSDGTRGWSTTYRYENGRLAKKTFYNSDGTRGWSTTYRYEDGRLVEEIGYDSDGTRKMSTTIFNGYDINGKLRYEIRR